MSTLGLQAEKIDQLLKENGIIGENASADVIRKAITNVIIANNKEITSQVSDFVIEKIKDSMNLRGHSRNAKSFSI